MRKIQKLAWLILAVGCSAGGAWAEDAVLRQLVEQAQYWQKKGRGDLASEAWRKLLQAVPRHPQALVQLGLIEARAGHIKAAEELYVSASQLPVAPPGLGELATLLKIEKAVPQQLSAARKSAQSGQPEEAVKNYRGILGATKPTGQFGLEYYQTLGSTKQGWEEARLGLEELARNNPGDARYLLALARHLTYRDAARREGIRQLAGLVERDSGEREAQKAWRQALVWLNAQDRDRALFTAYLAKFPQDQAIAERLRSLDRPVAKSRVDLPVAGKPDGFRLLEQGKIDQAETYFRDQLEKNPRNADALGGLATIRLRQESFGEAVRLLDQAMLLDGRNAKRWRPARNSAQYWLLIQEIRQARQSGQLDQAQSKLAQALKIDAGEPVGQVISADLLAEKKDFARAEPIYRRVLKTAPLDQGALAGLSRLLGETGRSDEALRMMSALEQSSGLQIGGLGQAKAAALLKLAEAEEQAGSYAAAAEKLEDAMLLDPLNPWVRLGLARQYQRLNDAGGANALLDNLLDSNPNFPEAWYARALLYATQGREWEGLQALEQIPPQARTQDMANEQRRLWVSVQVQRARQFAEQGNQRQANALMAQAETAAAQNTALQGMVASGWSGLGQPAKALRMLRELLSRNPSQNSAENLALRIQYAGALLGQRQDAELAAVLNDLATRPLSAAQQKEINNVIIAYTLQQTDALREAGRLAEAYDTINPALEQSDDPRLQMALARLYNTAGEPAQALQLAENVIAREPDELDHRIFAAGVAIGAKALDKAAGHAEAALELAPEHPRALALAGRVEKVRGNLTQAMAYFQAAQAREREQDVFAGPSGNLALRLIDEAPVAPASQAAPLARSERSGQLPGLLPLPASLRQRSAPSVMPYQGRGSLSQPLPEKRTMPVPAGSRLLEPLAPLPAVQVLPAFSYFAPDKQRVLPPSPVGLTSKAVLPLASTARREPVASQSRERTVSEEIRTLEAQATATLDAGVSLRSRSGDAGTSRVREVETPLEAKIPVGYAGDAITLRVSPVLLSAGKVNLADENTARKFGSVALTPVSQLPYGPVTQTARGTALSAGYQNERIATDIGVAPLGFKASNVVGGLSLSSQFDTVALKAAVSRRAVTDSLLSYAGTQDPLSGRVWGGVVKNAIKFSAGYDSGNYGVYAGAGYGGLTGLNVKSNTQLEAGIGTYFHPYQSADARLTLGLNLSAFGYRENLGSYTLGHGGYFSPQQYVSLGLPFDLAGRQGKLSYQIGGDIGIRHFRQDRAPYFPNEPAMQAAWEQRVALNPASAGSTAYYNGETVTGAGYNIYGSFEYALVPQFALGGRLKFDNSRNFSQQTGLLYLRYTFDAMPQASTFPPRTLKPLHQGEPL